MTEAVFVILAMAVVTFGLRAAGYVVGSRLPQKGRVAAAMNALPGAILIGIVVPQALMTGIAETIAALIAGATAALTRNIVAAMVAGALSVWLLRSVIAS